MRSLRVQFLVLGVSLASALVGSRPADAAVPVLAMAAPRLEGQLNPNHATVEQWELLPGIGPTTAARIVEYVRKHPVRQLAQLMRVDGIGRKTFDKMRPFLTLAGETTLRVADGEGTALPRP
jgi:DNA uptake protein ComE-like DNA-binding protein